jgi:hypothetical protein
MADDKKYKLTCFIEGDKSTFSVLVSCNSEVNELRRLIYQEGELDRFDFRLLDLIVRKVCQAFHVIMGVVVFLADLIVSQVEIDLKSLQGRISQLRLDNRRHQSVDFVAFIRVMGGATSCSTYSYLCTAAFKRRTRHRYHPPHNYVRLAFLT